MSPPPAPSPPPLPKPSTPDLPPLPPLPAPAIVETAPPIVRNHSELEGYVTVLEHAQRQRWPTGTVVAGPDFVCETALGVKGRSYGCLHPLSKAMVRAFAALGACSSGPTS